MLLNARGRLSGSVDRQASTVATMLSRTRGAATALLRNEGLSSSTDVNGVAVVGHTRRQIASKAVPDPEGGIPFVDMMYGNPLGLPRLPIPPLQETIKRYLQVINDGARAWIFQFLCAKVTGVLS